MAGGNEHEVQANRPLWRENMVRAIVAGGAEKMESTILRCPVGSDYGYGVRRGVGVLF